MFDLSRYYIVVVFNELKLPSMKKKQKVMVAEVVHLLGAFARNPTGCNRGVGGSCSCVSHLILEVRYMCEFEFGYISPHFVGM